MTEQTTPTETVVVATPEVRPGWLPEKFKSGEELAKSYHELEKKVGTAPEEYDFTKSKFLDADYVPFQELGALAKEKRVPKEVIDKMIESVDKYMDEFSIDPVEEEKKMGDNAKERIKVLDNWAKVNLSDSSYKALTNNLRSADAIKALEELRGKMMSNNVTVPNGNDGTSNNVATVADLQAEIGIPANFEKYKTDAKYRADWQGRLDLASKNSGFLDKVGP